MTLDLAQLRDFARRYTGAAGIPKLSLRFFLQTDRSKSTTPLHPYAAMGWPKSLAAS